MEPPPLNLTLRVGCRMTYEAKETTAAIFMIKPRRDESQRVLQERFTFNPSLPGTEYQDEHENIVFRAVLPEGATTIEHDSLVAVSSHYDNFGLKPQLIAHAKMPRS